MLCCRQGEDKERQDIVFDYGRGLHLLMQEYLVAEKSEDSCEWLRGLPELLPASHAGVTRRVRLLRHPQGQKLVEVGEGCWGARMQLARHLNVDWGVNGGAYVCREP